MKRGILILGAVLFLGFTPKTHTFENKEIKEEFGNNLIAQEINSLNQIIEHKLEKIALLKNKYSALLLQDENSVERIDLIKEIKLQQMMILKYKAAIACKTHHN